jgi:predicted RND superfamily exporter protein
LTNTLTKELRPIVLTTIALTAGFLVLGFSSLLLHREAAVVYAVAFLAALVADLLLLPSLLVSHKPTSSPGR